ncbi:MAG: hypothetical protein ACI4N6_05635 [Eubacteriales bacterium]
MKTTNTAERKNDIRKKKQTLSEALGQILRGVFTASICGAVISEDENNILF